MAEIKNVELSWDYNVRWRQDLRLTSSPVDEVAKMYFTHNLT